MNHKVVRKSDFSRVRSRYGDIRAMFHFLYVRIDFVFQFRKRSNLNRRRFFRSEYVLQLIRKLVQDLLLIVIVVGSRYVVTFYCGLTRKSNVDIGSRINFVIDDGFVGVYNSCFLSVGKYLKVAFIVAVFERDCYEKRAAFARGKIDCFFVSASADNSSLSVLDTLYAFGQHGHVLKGYFVFSILVAGCKQAYDANERQ